MSLATGRELYCYQWDTLPVGEDVINRVHTLAIEDDQPKIDANFMYEWEIGGEAAFPEEEEDEQGENVDELLQNEVRDAPIILAEEEDDGSDEEDEMEDEEGSVDQGEIIDQGEGQDIEDPEDDDEPAVDDNEGDMGDMRIDG